MESFLLTIMVVHLVVPSEGSGEWTGLNVLVIQMEAGTVISVMTFLAVLFLVVRYYRTDNAKTTLRIVLALLASLLTYLVALVLIEYQASRRWAISLNVAVLTGSVFWILRQRSEERDSQVL
jgi:hypothetical protein